MDVLVLQEEPLPYQHPERIRGMFGSIARRYDLANHLLSGGIDFYWRKRTAKIVRAWRPKVVVDLATGTGDLALVLQRDLPEAEITGADFSEEMLARAKRKGVRKTMVADAMRLPFADGSIDCVTVAFGLRNMENYGGALREMSRVLKSKGYLLVLEFSLPQNTIMRSVYRFYLHRCLPVLGSLLTQKKSAYDYLGDSIEAFPSGDAMIRLLEASGFDHPTEESLTGGVVTIYTAQKR